ncbi:MAG: sulfite exporter TauE/SafE family protein [Deltaproteobacteria bacterium]|nr:sulfite exporter TauE/SafE family protein [Deltaproteobacteria bacterium]MBW2383146.1 sulfite exporter TauE/SafE family protein [Deltaproteobacteria bacterium]MBW2698801.1 sulfite exporter TauE/SafE family protein [Deltaproteobacteria bacterium]
MEPLHIALLVGVGGVAGVINTLAGGGSLLSVPLLVFVGLPGDLANGTNRIGVAVQCATATWRFRAEGISGLSRALPVLVPVCLGSLIGAAAISQLGATQFERLFGIVMLLLLYPTLRGGLGEPRSREPARTWPAPLRFGVFFVIGLYGGAVQAGVGLLLIVALDHSGIDLVLANSIKVVVVMVLTLVAVPVFILEGQVVWGPAIALTAGFATGGIAGARLAIHGGERLIRPALAVAVVALAGRMLDLY